MTERHEDNTTLSTADMAGKRPTAEPNPGSRDNVRSEETMRSNEPSTTAAPAATTGNGSTAATATMTRPPTPPAASDQHTTPLLPGEQASTYRSQWESVQTGFVDEPRQAVERADHLVAEVIKRIAEVFADERSKLEEQWSKGNEVDTEELRVALKRYRSFFERLLSA